MRPARVAALLLCGFLGSGCATTAIGVDDVADLEPGERPEAETTEGGLWMQVANLEEEVQTSGARIEDPALNAYLSELVCRIAGDYCGDIRVYVLDVPHFNATTFPNGMMNVWTGLLLRCQNEAQLAAVLGHEIGHYVRRHGLKRWKDWTTKANLLTAFALVAGAASAAGAPGGGAAVQIAELVAIASIYAYSRDNEREADAIGLSLMAQAGYRAEEAAEVWAYVVREEEAGDEGYRSVLLASHPAPEERIRNLRALAAQLDTVPGRTGRDAFREATRPWLEAWMQAELALRQFDRTQVVLAHLRESGVDASLADFFDGELHRLRGREGDAKQAVAAYRRALAADPTHAPTYRALGLLLMKTAEKDAARRHLSRYLELDPLADDRAMVESLLP